MRDVITELRVEGMRCIDSLRLPLGKLTVAIGENGAGKSTLVEAIELLRVAGTQDLSTRIYDRHGGLSGILRRGSGVLRIGVTVEGDDGRIEYDVAVAGPNGAIAVVEERLDLDLGKAEPLHVIQRSAGRNLVFDQSQGKLVEVSQISPSQLTLTAFGALPPQAAIGRLREVLAGIDVHLPFQVTAGWARDDGVLSPRRSARLESTDGLSLWATNLASAYHALKTDFPAEHWAETMELVRLGLGYECESVDANVRAAAGPGLVLLTIRDRRFREPIPASSLSDGMLSYLAFVALCRLNQHKSLVAFDEPEVHLHPRLLARVVQLFERLSEQTPVLLTTHSNQLLECLSDPVASTLRCELDETGASRWLRMDPAEYAKWLEDYSGLGDMRAAGIERVLMRHEIGR